MSVERYYDKDGRVAVLYSPGYGAGWSTWSTSRAEDLMFDRRIVELVLNNERAKITESFMVSLGYDDIVYCGGAKQLEVEWLQPGTMFKIDEDRGNEQIVTPEKLYYTA